MSKEPRIRISRKADKYDAENELWENGTYGTSPEHMQLAPAEVDRALDEAMGLHLLTFRMQKETVEKLKQLAALDGIGYQPLMRQILNRWVHENEYRLEKPVKSRAAVKAKSSRVPNRR